jgi:hypothetical protein
VCRTAAGNMGRVDGYALGMAHANCPTTSLFVMRIHL